ncbi:MAG TPA: hypothetical protein ENH24_00035 [Nitrospirae bacterium]|nr:hypothetical protein [Nitrospirota bacterium]
MKKIPYGKYTKEFRLETVKLVTDGGLSIPEASRRYLKEALISINLLLLMQTTSIVLVFDSFYL